MRRNTKSHVRGDRLEQRLDGIATDCRVGAERQEKGWVRRLAKTPRLAILAKNRLELRRHVGGPILSSESALARADVDYPIMLVHLLPPQLHHLRPTEPGEEQRCDDRGVSNARKRSQPLVVADEEEHRARVLARETPGHDSARPRRFKPTEGVRGSTLRFHPSAHSCHTTAT